MFSKTRIRWPGFVKQLFQILSAFNLNLELTAPGELRAAAMRAC